MMLLPLSKLQSFKVCFLPERIAAFQAYHGFSPGEDTTIHQWAQATPHVSDMIWALRFYPEVSVEFSRRCAERAAEYVALAIRAVDRAVEERDVVQVVEEGSPSQWAEAADRVRVATKAAQRAQESARHTAYWASSAAMWAERAEQASTVEDAAMRAGWAAAKAAQMAARAGLTEEEAGEAGRAGLARERAAQRRDILGLTDPSCIRQYAHYRHA